MKIIDIDNWERKTQFLNFSKYTHPVFSVGVRLDVTDLVAFCHNNGYSFFPVFLFVVSKCSNQITELKTRINKDKVIQYDIVHPSYVVLRDDKCIATCMTRFDENFEKFYSETRKDIDLTKKDNSFKKFNSHTENDCLYVSSLQWLDISTMSNPYNFEDAEQTSVPRITWGKYVQNSDNRYEMGFHISVHHGLMDGWHIAQLVQKIEKAIANIEDFLR